VIGWQIAFKLSTTAPVVKITQSGANRFTLSWTNSATGFVLQERTNLTSGTWIASVSGSSNPAVVVSTAAQKFYRLYNATAPALAQPQVAAVQSSSTTNYQQHIHISRRR